MSALVEGLVFKDNPFFYLNGDAVSIIRSPDEFFSKLKGLVGTAKTRIHFASLYFGTGEKEDELVSCFLESFSKNSDLRGTVLLDYCRASRGESNSCTKLLSLKKQFPNRFDVALFHSPLLRNFWKKVLPQRWNEIIGVQHMKIYVIDDCIIISGANLSTNYFTNRQDRYVLLRNANLADFYVDLINLVARMSFRLTPNGAVTLHDSCPEHPYNGSYSRFCKILKRDIQCLLERWRTKQQNAVTHNCDTVVYPLVQLGAVGLHTDDQVIIQFVRDTDQSDQYDLYLASGYFNPTRAYADALLNTSKHCHLLLASRESNGFYGAKGFSRQVPHIYLSYVYDFLNDIVRRDQQHRLLLTEYARDGWTFHAKGIWLRGTKSDSPYYTIIGSSNFGNCISTNAQVS
ncbi:phospholipase D domain protein [Trichuris suis]|nr:phospholipase D domain protein [Trichuris suis]